MTKMNNHEMKSAKAGANPLAVECVCACLDAGWEYEDARDFCRDLFPDED